jgi:hypothetical protein
MPRRFVILRHEMPADSPRGSHWDLMLEGDERLVTWAFAEEPGSSPTQTADRLPDHRKAYLDYEGPVAGGRGIVRRWDHGHCTLESADDSRWMVRLSGNRLHCRLRLEKHSPAGSPDSQRWTCRWEDEAADAC